ncbi:MAG TPA: hypothetical protein VLF91_03625 [Candidatus Saccharimonadales bacterium]|nr:hypothetical protein [Candidatus Saccharimonadales bacterium]
MSITDTQPVEAVETAEVEPTIGDFYPPFTGTVKVTADEATHTVTIDIDDELADDAQAVALAKTVGAIPGVSVEWDVQVDPTIRIVGVVTIDPAHWDESSVLVEPVVNDALGVGDNVVCKPLRQSTFVSPEQVNELRTRFGALPGIGRVLVTVTGDQEAYKEALANRPSDLPLEFAKRILKATGMMPTTTIYVFVDRGLANADLEALSGQLEAIWEQVVADDTVTDEVGGATATSPEPAEPDFV